MKARNQKTLLFFSIILLFITIPLVSVIGAIYLAPFEIGEQDLVITGNDVIKNFKIDSFDGYAISSGGTTPDLGDRLKFELGAEWKTSPDDINIISIQQVGTEVVFRYRVLFTLEATILTNVRLPDAIENGKSLDPVEEEILAGLYGHYNSLGFGIGGWDSYFTWSHLDVGNLRDKTAEDNTFSGNIQYSFDIDDSPFPNTITDINGNPATKNFAYISVASAYVGEQTHGQLSNDIPTSVGLTPLEYEEQESELSGGDSQSMHFSTTWNPQPTLSEQVLTNTVDFGLNFQSSGSSLDPKTKDGQSIWNPESERSMTDCVLTYNLGSISPLVREYSRSLSWYYQHVKTQEYLASILPWSIGVKVIQDLNRAETETRTTAVHVTNRYIQTSLAVAFDVYSSYNVQAIETDMPELQEPEEYYDDLVFESVVDGFGGGYTYVEGHTTTLFGSALIDGIVLVVVIAVIALIVYVVWRQYNRKRKAMQALAQARKY